MIEARGLALVLMALAGALGLPQAAAGVGPAKIVQSTFEQSRQNQKRTQREWSVEGKMVFYAATDVAYSLTAPQRAKREEDGDGPGTQINASGRATFGTKLALSRDFSVAGSVSSQTRRHKSNASENITDRVDAVVNATYRSPLGLLSFRFNPAALASSTDVAEPDRLQVDLRRPGWMPGDWQATDYFSWTRIDPQGIDGGYQDIAFTRRVNAILRPMGDGTGWSLSLAPRVHVRQFASSPDPSIDERRDITASLAAIWDYRLADNAAFSARINMEKRYSNFTGADDALAGIRFNFAARF
ncbi:MAG: hypothetical protein Tsb0016_08480 [Sphingomonadales bacterium]